MLCIVQLLCSRCSKHCHDVCKLNNLCVSNAHILAVFIYMSDIIQQWIIMLSSFTQIVTCPCREKTKENSMPVALSMLLWRKLRRGRNICRSKVYSVNILKVIINVHSFCEISIVSDVVAAL